MLYTNFFFRLSLQHPVGKFLGECNDIKRALNKCLKEEVLKSFLCDIQIASLVEGDVLCNSNFECNICSRIFVKRGFNMLMLNIIRGVNDKSVNKYVDKN